MACLPPPTTTGARNSEHWSTKCDLNAWEARPGPPIRISLLAVAFSSRIASGTKALSTLRPGRGDHLQRRGEDDLVGSLPNPRKVAHDRRRSSEAGVGFPNGHRVVHLPPVQMRAGWPREVIDEPVHLIIGHGPVELAIQILDVAVKRRDYQVDELGRSWRPLTCQSAA